MYIVTEYLVEGKRTPPSPWLHYHLSPPQAACYNISGLHHYHLILIFTWLPRFVQLWHILKSIALFTETWYVTKGNTHIVTATCYTQAARNCFVGERNLVKVGHFERAIFVPNDEYIAPGSSTFAVKWAAPEVLTYGKFSSKSDVWSYGEHEW